MVWGEFPSVGNVGTTWNKPMSLLLDELKHVAIVLFESLSPVARQISDNASILEFHQKYKHIYHIFSSLCIKHVSFHILSYDYTYIHC